MELHYIWLIPVIPLLGAIYNGTWGMKAKTQTVSLVGCGVIALAFVLALSAYFKLLSLPGDKRLIVDHLFTWIAVGSFKAEFAFQFDPLSAVMALVVSGVGLLIHIYSTGYMKGDPGYARYFAYINLFIFSMLVLVLSDNLMGMFLGWEGVGVCSYLLIGFWYEDDEKASAGKKAFIVNRIGDAGFIFGIALVFAVMDTVNFEGMRHYLAGRELLPALIAAMCIAFFIGAMGKSAQIPLYVWLPDAMAGPTPVSALIHAATMVTAGVYLVCRLNFLFILSPLAMNLVAGVGLCTALLAALIAFTQNDIKKVLAYSTISQLGYMFLAAGVGLFSGAIFHLVTHAFFKACLFLGAGSVIHSMSGEQDIRKMGGIASKMPITHWTFLFSSLAIAGIVPFAGFFSKDEILWGAYASPFGGFLFWFVGWLTAGLTAFYMFRLYFAVFQGECRADHHVAEHVHESPWAMTLPLRILGSLALVGGFLGLPKIFNAHINLIEGWLAPLFEASTHAWPHHGVGIELLFMFLSLLMAGSMIGLAYFLWKRPEYSDGLANVAPLWRFYELSLNKFYVDELYDRYIVQPIKHFSITWLWNWLDATVIDGWLVNGAASLVTTLSYTIRFIQTGNVQLYLLVFLVSAFVIFYSMV